jgi:integrase/recombinase XerD
MMLEELVRSQELQARARAAPLGPHIDELASSAARIGFTRSSLQSLLYGVIQFGVFLRKRGITDLEKLRSRDVDAFVKTQPLRRCHAKYCYRFSKGVRGARHVFKYALARGITHPDPSPPPPRYAPLLEEWTASLQHHRGLAPKSIDLYRRHLQRFLADLGGDGTALGLRNLKPDRVRAYVRRATLGYARAGRNSLVSALRVFLRFAWDRGYLSRDLGDLIERVPTFKHDRLPRGPRWEDACRLLTSADRSTGLGRRDYAILQLLLSYGVRAQQVCRLRLDDLDWRGEFIHFSPLKGGRAVDVPLLRPVGEAVLGYLQRGRPTTAGRTVFLSTRPPFAPLTTSAITGLVARAFVRGDVRSPHRGSHALRHAWATRLLAAGQPLKTIADLLGHRSLETTRIYAKVDFARLRTVALPWPKEAGQ